MDVTCCHVVMSLLQEFLVDLALGSLEADASATVASAPQEGRATGTDLNRCLGSTATNKTTMRTTTSIMGWKEGLEEFSSKLYVDFVEDSVGIKVESKFEVIFWSEIFCSFPPFPATVTKI